MYKTGHLQYGEALAQDRDRSKEDHMMAQGQSFTRWSAGLAPTLLCYIADFLKPQKQQRH